jgi:hypothetical protein
MSNVQLTGKERTVLGKPKPRRLLVQPSDPSVRLIGLTRGMVATVDADDYERLSRWHWYAMKKRNGYYAYRGDRSTGKLVIQGMHREVMGVGYGEPREVDHRNSAMTLDNRKQNLRFADRTGQCCNKRIQSNNKCGFKGVHFSSGTRIRRWKAEIKIGSTRKCLGYFLTAEEAHVAYVAASIQMHGEFAHA